MSVRYRVPVAEAILADPATWEIVEGFRLVSVDGPWLAHPYATICTFEDDNAPPELEGALVEPVFQTELGPDGQIAKVTITSRQRISVAY